MLFAGGSPLGTLLLHYSMPGDRVVQNTKLIFLLSAQVCSSPFPRKPFAQSAAADSCAWIRTAINTLSLPDVSHPPPQPPRPARSDRQPAPPQVPLYRTRPLLEPWYTPSPSAVSPKVQDLVGPALSPDKPATPKILKGPELPLPRRLIRDYQALPADLQSVNLPPSPLYA